MNQQLEKKQTGATFTPKKLADYLSKKLIQYLDAKNNFNVLDPACGEGELLISIGKHLDNLGVDYSLSGFDSNESYLEDARDRIINNLGNNPNLFNQDFLSAINVTDSQKSLDLFANQKSTESNRKFDLIIANPPYVGSHSAKADQSDYVPGTLVPLGNVIQRPATPNC